MMPPAADPLVGETAFRKSDLSLELGFTIEPSLEPMFGGSLQAQDDKLMDTLHGERLAAPS
jgi:hypothetical protein